MSDMKTVLEKLVKLDEKLDQLDGRIDNIDVTMAKQQVSLDYHIKRSDQADNAIKILSEELEPVKSHVAAVNTIIKATAWVIGILATLVAIYSALK